MTVATKVVSMILHSAHRREYPELSLLDFDVRQLKTSVQARFPSLNAKPIRRLAAKNTVHAGLIEKRVRASARGEERPDSFATEQSLSQSPTFLHAQFQK